MTVTVVEEAMKEGTARTRKDSTKITLAATFFALTLAMKVL